MYKTVLYAYAAYGKVDHAYAICEIISWYSARQSAREARFLIAGRLIPKWFVETRRARWALTSRVATARARSRRPSSGSYGARRLVGEAIQARVGMCDFWIPIL